MSYLDRIKIKVIETYGKYGSIARFRAKMKRDANFQYNMANFAMIFKKRESLAPSDEAITRIMTAYQRAKRAQAGTSPNYAVSNEWVPIYNRYLGSIIEALSKGDLAAVKRLYTNFFREDLSSGLAGMPTSMKRCYFSGNTSEANKIWFVQDGVYRVNLWKSLFPGADTAALQTPEVGNSYGLQVDGRYLRVGSEYQHYYAVKCLTLLDQVAGNSASRVLMELGGGYGGCAYFMKHLCKGDLTYIDVDLPETLALATFYLMSIYPEAKFALYGESFDWGNCNDFDFVMMPSFEIEAIKPGSVQLIFNSYSLAEMEPDAIRNYVKQFRRISPDRLFHVNHTKNSKLGANSFGLEDAGFVCIDKKEALWNLGRSTSMDEFEFSYLGPNRKA